MLFTRLHVTDQSHFLVSKGEKTSCKGLKRKITFFWVFLQSARHYLSTLLAYKHTLRPQQKCWTPNLVSGACRSVQHMLSAEFLFTWMGSCCLKTGVRSGKMRRTYSSLVHSSAISSTLGSTKGTMSRLTNSEVSAGKIRYTTTLWEEGKTNGFQKLCYIFDLKTDISFTTYNMENEMTFKK